MSLLQRADPAISSRSPGRRWLPFVGTTLAAAAAVGTVATLDPNRPGHYPTCPFLFVTGLWCPGCGTMRAVHDLAHLDLAGALARNPLTVVLVPVLVYAWVAWGARLAGRDLPRVSRVPAAVIWGFLVVVVTYAVLRNVPGWTWLSPA
ncbi:membrane protein [Marmoricola endophyticus]|uniref:Membrane protein n=1 Tax=Marmoricola endophyticus TaxID=2040280 RepID=A0A917BLR3_9ACTN|nr:DUF2752 domain-containing protein [Marmoricola endophyticus]GGF51065.1 membrane protein [Marmoricola endophyticus]